MKSSVSLHSHHPMSGHSIMVLTCTVVFGTRELGSTVKYIVQMSKDLTGGDYILVYMYSTWRYNGHQISELR